MSDFEFDFEWIQPKSTDIPEFEATWAELRLVVEEERISRFYSSRTNSVRSTLILPLYPLAEWIASKWWNLFYEAERPGRSANDTYAFRHRLRYARDGYALPDLKIAPVGDEVLLQWSRSKLEYYQIEFLNDGTFSLDRDEARDEFGRFLDAVDERLREKEVEDTLFQKDWKAIQTAPEEERIFCRAAARLGLDPYALPDEEEQVIIEASELLAEELYPAFFGTADFEKIQDQVQLLRDAIDTLRGLDVRADRLKQLRDEIPLYQPHRFPWTEGYEYATLLRRELGWEGRLFDEGTDDVLEAFAGPGDNVRDGFTRQESRGLFDALVSLNEQEAPGFAVDKRRESSAKFTLCRGLFEYFNTVNGRPTLVTREQTHRQQRNRAFAAEFLAPSDYLKERVSGDTVDEEEVEDIAEDLNVSSFVVHHQLKNHDVVDEVIS